MYFCMSTEISSTEAVRNFGDCLSRVKHRGETFIIKKNNKPVAEIRPAGVMKSGTLANLLEIWKPDSEDTDFADDLEKANSGELPSVERWDS